MTVDAVLKSLGTNFLSVTDRGFIYGPLGCLLRRNIETFWFRNCAMALTYNIFFTSPDRIPETLRVSKDITPNDAPFGLAMLNDIRTPWNHSTFSSDIKTIPHRTARVTVIIDELEAKNLFHKKQRERKVWWRKFARSPSRFQLTENKRVKNYDVVDIEAQFPFGNIIVETITHRHDARKLFPQNEEQNNNSSSNLNLIEHTASLDWGCLTLLCDGYDKIGGSQELHIHPKLSPYKVAFKINSEGGENIQELNDLIMYISNIIKKEGIATVLTSTKEGLESLYTPFIVIVDDESLEHGIVKVISRLTTIGESVHITNIAQYFTVRCN
ncbi:DNA polymerase subunit gamma-2, mitochondrial [Orussus abietinus]|uniref:DNA polymerase subunit gamma-2, mitochondrial n=1 Tax=Orussus abietinus TaxID=222816 RepID=UPI0006262501|nr:DNA polymerase subunit gamma-2, mitochondrial [Orussus abietinus]